MLSILMLRGRISVPNFRGDGFRSSVPAFSGYRLQQSTFGGNFTLCTESLPIEFATSAPLFFFLPVFAVASASTLRLMGANFDCLLLDYERERTHVSHIPFSVNIRIDSKRLFEGSFRNSRIHLEHLGFTMATWENSPMLRGRNHFNGNRVFEMYRKTLRLLCSTFGLIVAAQISEMTAPEFSQRSLRGSSRFSIVSFFLSNFNLAEAHADICPLVALRKPEVISVIRPSFALPSARATVDSWALLSRSPHPCESPAPADRSAWGDMRRKAVISCSRPSMHSSRQHRRPILSFSSHR
jgi:hypothetical protein